MSITINLFDTPITNSVYDRIGINDPKNIKRLYKCRYRKAVSIYQKEYVMENTQ